MCYTAERNNLVGTNLCPQVIKEAIKSFVDHKWLEKHSTKEKLVLYHYTSVEGLKGIIDSRSFRNSDIKYLNDPLELEYGKKIILDILGSYLNKENGKIIKKIIKRLKYIIGMQETYNTYITCFSEYDNLLSQWDRYATKGYGYNIGIHFSSSWHSRTHTWYNLDELSEYKYLPSLRKVAYQIDEQNGLVEKYLDAIIEASRKYLDGANNINVALDAIVSIEAADILLEFMYSFKSLRYSEENEWRLVYMIDRSWKPEIRNHRVNNNIIKPFLNMYIYNIFNGSYYFPLHSIKCGPMLQKVTAEKSLEAYINCTKNCSQHIIRIPDLIEIH